LLPSLGLTCNFPVGGSQYVSDKIKIRGHTWGNLEYDEEVSICHILSTNGDLQMKIVFVQYGTKSECRVVGESEEALKSASGAKVLEDFSQLLESKELTDLEIQTKDGKVFPVHKCFFVR
jgi:hypothetical protein